MSEPAGATVEAVDALTDNGLYAIGAWFCDHHPDLVDEVLADSEAIERDGIEAWSAREQIEPDDAVRTLMTGLAIRLFMAVAGGRAPVG